MVMAGCLVVVLAAATDIAPPASGTWVVDRTGQLSAETKQQVDALANEVNAAGVAKLAVLVTDTVEEGTPREFAWAVFRHWQLGSDGVLVMIAVESRKAEIIFGSRRPLSEAQTDVVMAEALVPNMKVGALDAAVLASVRALHSVLLVSVVPLPPPEPPTLVQRAVDTFFCGVALLIAVGGPLFLLYALLTHRSWRRRCAKCKTQRTKLAAPEEDAHLTVEQQEEQRSRLHAYDVWWCPQCSDALVSKWSASVTSVRHCPQCRQKSAVLTPASRERKKAGEMTLTETCRCGYSHTWVAFIPESAVFSSDGGSSSDSGGGSSDSGGGSSGSW